MNIANPTKTCVTTTAGDDATCTLNQ